MDDLTVTVYIPTHNRPLLLKRALISVVNQSYKAIEIIVVDDASEPKHQQENQHICESFSNVIYVQFEQSKGASAARNAAISIAKGYFITGLDDDDEFLPDRISAFITAWQTLKPASLLCTGYQFILPGNSVIKSGRKALWIDEHRIKHINDVGNQVFTRTIYFKNIGGFDADMVACQDYDTWIRLIGKFGRGYRLALQNYIVHQEHEFPRISQFSRRLDGHKQLIEKHKNSFNPSQLRSQTFFRKLYGGEKNVWRLIKLAGWRHIGVLIKMLLTRLISSTSVK